MGIEEACILRSINQQAHSKVARLTPHIALRQSSFLRFPAAISGCRRLEASAPPRHPKRVALFSRALLHTSADFFQSTHLPTC